MRLRLVMLASLTCAAIVLPGPRVLAQTRVEPKTPPAQVPVQVQPPVTQLVPGMEIDANQKRERLEEVMRKYPPSLGRILKTDPSLMQEPSYLARYPALAAFLAANPEVMSNPGFYFDHVYVPGESEPRDAQSVAMSAWRDMMQTASVIMVMAFVALVLAWLVRTVLNHRRWLRLTRVQDEVHNKLLDRFSGNGRAAHLRAVSRRPPLPRGGADRRRGRRPEARGADQPYPLVVAGRSGAGDWRDWLSVRERQRHAGSRAGLVADWGARRGLRCRVRDLRRAVLRHLEADGPAGTGRHGTSGLAHTFLIAAVF